MNHNCYIVDWTRARRTRDRARQAWYALHRQRRFARFLGFDDRARGAVSPPTAGASELYLNENIFVHTFANDLPRRQAERLWASQRGASTLAFDTPPQTAAWETIPF